MMVLSHGCDTVLKPQVIEIIVQFGGGGGS